MPKAKAKALRVRNPNVMWDEGDLEMCHGSSSPLPYRNEKMEAALGAIDKLVNASMAPDMMDMATPKKIGKEKERVESTRWECGLLFVVFCCCLLCSVMPPTIHSQ